MKRELAVLMLSKNCLPMKKFKFNSYNTRSDKEDNPMSESDSHRSRLSKAKSRMSQSVRRISETRLVDLENSQTSTGNTNEIAYLQQPDETITWRGRVLELRKTTIVAELIDSSKIRASRIVEISYNFHGQDLHDFSCNARFTLQQTISSEREGVKVSKYYILKQLPLPIDTDEVKRTIDRQMKKFAYMFSDD